MSTAPSIGTHPATRLSRLLAWACLACAVVLPTLTAYATWRLRPEDWRLRLGINAPADLPPEHVLAVSLLAVLPVLVLAFGLIKAHHCLRGLARGEVFALSTVAHLRAFAGALVIASLLGLVIPAISSVLLSWHAAPGQRALALNLSSSDLLLALFAGIIWQVASVFAKAVELAEDHAQIV